MTSIQSFGVGGDWAVRKWDANSGALLATFKGVNGHSKAVTALFPIREYVISSSLDKKMKVYSPLTDDSGPQVDATEEVTTMALAKSVNGRPLLVCGSSNGNIMIRSLAVTGSPLLLLRKIVSFSIAPAGHTRSTVQSIEAGTEGNTFCSMDDGKLIFWRINGDLW